MKNLSSNIRAVSRSPAMVGSYARWLATKVALGRGPRITITDRVYLGEWVSFSEYIGFRDILPEKERSYIARSLRPALPRGAVAFDVGANIGAFTCLLASLGSQVHAFEPVPETYCRLGRNVKLNQLSDATVLNCMALGSELGLTRFDIEEFAAATNRMSSSNELNGSHLKPTQLLCTISLDEYCDIQRIKQIDFLKLDVEGMEPHVLRGAKNTMKERIIRKMMIEICPINLRSVGSSVSELWATIKDSKYSPHLITSSGEVGRLLSEADLEAMDLENVALVPDV